MTQMHIVYNFLSLSGIESESSSVSNYTQLFKNGYTKLLEPGFLENVEGGQGVQLVDPVIVIGVHCLIHSPLQCEWEVCGAKNKWIAKYTKLVIVIPSKQPDALDMKPDGH
jgi:hypothetical protein